MTPTVPNKEIIRRVCHLFGATKCYLCPSNTDGSVDILTNIPSDELKNCAHELESWGGMKFKVFNFTKHPNELNRILQNSEEILPIKL